MIEFRRHLHMHPETGFNLVLTHDHVAGALRDAGMIVHEHVGVNSLVGVIVNGTGPVIGLRADMDALPLTEENTELPWCSQTPGKMHACGHDAHTAMLLTAGRYLKDHPEAWHGTVKLLFQEAEEGPSPGGAEGIVRSGLVDDVDVFYALHVSPAFPSGVIALKPGEAMAAADTIEIILKGKGAHAAYPHLGIDPILMQAEVVVALQALVSRVLDPMENAVLTIAQVHAGTTHNIIPSTAYLEGTVRTFNEATRSLLSAGIETVVKSVTTMRGGSYEYEYLCGYDPVVNAEVPSRYFQKIAEQVVGADRFAMIAKASMGAEDFSKYIRHRTGCMGWLGVAKDEATSLSLHHPRFNIDEEALLSGAAVLAGLVIGFDDYPNREEIQ